MSQATEAAPATTRPAILPPTADDGVLGWMRKNLFSSVGNSITTIVLVALVVWIAVGFVDWAVLHATFRAESGKDCTQNQGAC